MNLTNRLAKWVGIAALASATLLMSASGGFAASNTVAPQDNASERKVRQFLEQGSAPSARHAAVVWRVR